MKNKSEAIASRPEPPKVALQPPLPPELPPLDPLAGLWLAVVPALLPGALSPAVLNAITR